MTGGNLADNIVNKMMDPSRNQNYNHRDSETMVMYRFSNNLDIFKIFKIRE